MLQPAHSRKQSDGSGQHQGDRLLFVRVVFDWQHKLNVGCKKQQATENSARFSVTKLFYPWSLKDRDRATLLLSTSTVSFVVLQEEKLPPSFSHGSFMFCPSALCETLNEDEEKRLCSRLFIHDLKLQFVHMSISKVCLMISSTECTRQ